MSEIRDKTIKQINEIIRRRKQLDYDDYCVGFDSYGIEEEILTIPELAVVDRDAELPEIQWGEKEESDLYAGSKQAQLDMQRAGYVKEVK